MPFRLYRHSRDKLNFFSQKDNFEEFNTAIQAFLKLHHLKANYTNINLTFCFNFLEHLTRERQYVIKYFSKKGTGQKESFETNFKYFNAFKTGVDGIYRSYLGHKNSVALESIFDLVSQALIEGHFKLYLRDDSI